MVMTSQMHRIMEIVDVLEDQQKVDLASDLFNYFTVNRENCKRFIEGLQETDRQELYNTLNQMMFGDEK